MSKNPDFDILYHHATVLPGAHKVTAMRFEDGSFLITVGEQARCAGNRLLYLDSVTGYFSNCAIPPHPVQAAGSPDGAL